MIEYQAAKLAAEQEYQKAFAAFEKAHQLDSTLHFLDWMNDSFGKDYLLAVENRERKSAALQNIQSEEMSDVGLLRQMLDSAKSRLVRKLG